MPIKALLNDDLIYSFMFSEHEWLQFKKDYKGQSLKMECCGHDAIPKTSQLNNYYFAHKQKSECQGAFESLEHVYLKYQVAKLAHEAGWDVQTEKIGHSPDDEKWIADVYCTKNKAKVAFEIQVSQQSFHEFKERQLKYSKSGVRCMWLYLIKTRTYHFINNINSNYELPIFAIQANKKKDYVLPEFDISLSEFITGVFNKDLEWRPKNKRKLIVKLIVIKIDCPHCKSETNVIIGLDVSTINKDENEYIAFDEPIVKKIIKENVSDSQLASFNISELRKKTRKSNLYNSCSHCNKEIEDDDLNEYFYYDEFFDIYCDDDDMKGKFDIIDYAIENPVYVFHIQDENNILYADRAWFFKNERQKRDF
ncbi:hypothetical protein V6478_003410 [Providencia rettgeri]